MPNLELIIHNVSDPIARQNFDKIKSFFKDDVFNHFDGKFFDIEFTKAVTNLRYPHYLGFLPKDILQTSKTGVGAVTWNYELFDKDNLDITTTGACRVRAFIGTYMEE